MSLATFKALVSELGAGLGVPAMAADDDGYVALTFDDMELHLQHEADADEIVVFTRLGEVEIDRAAEIYGMLLGANLFWQGTRGATFSVEPDLGVVFLADRQPAGGMALERLNEWLEHFLDTTDYWRKRLAAANAGGPLIDVEVPGGDSPAPPNGGGQGGPGGPDFMLRA
jgi:hypothetical protein